MNLWVEQPFSLEIILHLISEALTLSNVINHQGPVPPSAVHRATICRNFHKRTRSAVRQDQAVICFMMAPAGDFLYLSNMFYPLYLCVHTTLLINVEELKSLFCPLLGIDSMKKTKNDYGQQNHCYLCDNNLQNTECKTKLYCLKFLQCYWMHQSNWTVTTHLK